MKPEGLILRDCRNIKPYRSICFPSNLENATVSHSFRFLSLFNISGTNCNEKFGEQHCHPGIEDWKYRARGTEKLNAVVFSRDSNTQLCCSLLWDELLIIVQVIKIADNMLQKWQDSQELLSSSLIQTRERYTITITMLVPAHNFLFL